MRTIVGLKVDLHAKTQVKLRRGAKHTIGLLFITVFNGHGVRIEFIIIVFFFIITHMMLVKRVALFSGTIQFSTNKTP